MEPCLHFNSLECSDLERDDGTRFVARCKESLSYRKCVARIHERDGLRMHFNCPHERRCWYFAIGNVEDEAKVAKELHGVNPCLDSSILVPQQRGFLSDGGHKLPRAHRSR